MEGPHGACEFDEKPMSHVSVSYLCPCRMSNLDVPVACHYIFGSPVACCISNLRKWLCRRVDFRGRGP